MNRTLLALVIVGAGLAGAAGYWLFGRPEAPPVPATTEPASTHEMSARKLVDTVPDFKLADRHGQLRSLRDWSGQSLVVNFWATWCAPCRREIPLLQQLARDRAADGFQVIGIAVDYRDKVLAYADEMHIDYPLLIGEQDALDAAAAFGVEAVGFPFTVFTDARGRVVIAHMGELSPAEAEVILDGIVALNAGEQELAEARRTISAGLHALAASANKSPG